MTDKQWQSAMVKCIAAFRKYDALLKEIESEYERRYHQHPSDVDDDYWLDTFQNCIGGDFPDLEMIKEQAKFNMEGGADESL